ncbi:hypothetical protein BTVI_40508 [Pitangus sulphuratus]|nr:hypothetical protein BTVI_40508 [Pitangus sulphuratus]
MFRLPHAGGSAHWIEEMTAQPSAVAAPRHSDQDIPVWDGELWVTGLQAGMGREIAAYLITFEKHEEWLTTSPKTREVPMFIALLGVALVMEVGEEPSYDAIVVALEGYEKAWKGL